MWTALYHCDKFKNILAAFSSKYEKSGINTADEANRPELLVLFWTDPKIEDGWFDIDGFKMDDWT